MKTKKVHEGLGAITINRKPVDSLNEPDVARALPNIIHTGRSSAVPNHWNNSPFMSGGRYGAGALSFGANPRKRSVMTYGQFIKRNKKFTKNN
jgi:hypothetical protein